MNNELFKNIDTHLLNDETPSTYINSILPELKGSPLKIINDLESVKQNPTHHPEGNVLNHILLVTDAAAFVRKYSNDKRVLMWGAFLHDIGKKKATKLKKGRIVAYNHDSYGKTEAEKILSLTDFFDESTKNKIINFVFYHMHSLYLSKNLPFGNLDNLMKDVDLNNILLLFFADRLGRGPLTAILIKNTISEIDIILKVISKDYNIQDSINFWTSIKNDLLASI